MDFFADYLTQIDSEDHRMRTKEILDWVEKIIHFNRLDKADCNTFWRK